MLPTPREAPAARMRLEWNGVAGLRQVRVERESAESAERCEHVVGEVSEPMS